MLIEPSAIDPLLAYELTTPIDAGVHAIDLEARGVTLEPDVDYRWFITLTVDGAREERLAQGAIRRMQPDRAWLREFENAPPEDRARLHAAAGHWYDAIALVSAAIEAAPGDPALRARRAELADQAGLASVAAFDRGRGTPSE